MFDKDTIAFLRDRFEASLKPHGWDVYGEQLFCDFLLKNGKQILRHGTDSIRERLKVLSSPEVRLGQEYLAKRDSRECLIAGDEFGFLRRYVEDCRFLFYSKESCQVAEKHGIKKPICLDEFSSVECKFETIVILQLMAELKERERVREIGPVLRTFFSRLSDKGELVISDKTLYQDDFVTHFVSMGAEIASIEQYGELDFFLCIRP